MGRALSLQEVYTVEPALHDRDRMVRIAAIHHARSRLTEGQPAALIGALRDPDPLVATYAAITLAQSGEWKGVEWLIARICNTPERQQRRHWEACFRNCSRFPFAVLLNELALLESIPRVRDPTMRPFLEGLLALTREGFYARATEDPEYRDRFVSGMARLDRVEGLDCRPKATCGMGLILSVPAGDRPGFLYSPQRQQFFRFRDAEVLNRDFVERGREVHYVVHRENQVAHPRSQERIQFGAYLRWKAAGGPHGQHERFWMEAEAEVADDTASAAEMVYVFEDMPPRPVELPAEVVSAPRRAGFMPGVVVATGGTGRPWTKAECSDGRTFQEACAEEPSLGELVLVEDDLGGGAPTCHRVSGPVPSVEAVQAVRRAHAARQ